MLGSGVLMVYPGGVQVHIDERDEPQLRCSLSVGLEHLKFWVFVTPLGDVPALYLWGCWDQGPWPVA